MVSEGDNLYEMSKLCVCVVCVCVCGGGGGGGWKEGGGGNKKDIISLYSAEFVHSVISVILLH